MSISIAALLLVAAIVYQTKSKRSPWLSPGEIIAGRDVEENQKVWVNPWCANRWALSTVLFITMIISANAWDGVAEGRIYPAAKIAVNAAVLIVLWIGFVAIGRGSSVGSGILVGYYVVMGGVLALSPNVTSNTPGEFNRGFGIALLLMAAVSFAVGVIYHRIRGTRRAEAGSGQGGP